jgi:hypothetical protein
MKKLALSIMFTVLAAIGAYAQSYTVTGAANLRSGPGSDYPVLAVLDAGTAVELMATEPENGYYKVMVSSKDLSGYIYNTVLGMAGGLDPFASSWSGNVKPLLSVVNKTSRYLTLAIDETSYVLSPGEKRDITVNAGNHHYTVSAGPDVLPLIGSKSFEVHCAYTWTFSIM